MTSKPKQIDLEALIAKAPKAPQAELADAFTGEIFQPRARNHYEENDGIPVAPPVELNRPTIRQRIENLINRDPAVLHRYLQGGPSDGSEGIDMEVPDDPEAPLTPSEQNFLDVVASDIAEAAPLPDEGLPRAEQLAPAAQVPQTAPAAPGGGPGAVPTPAVAPAAPPVPTR